MPSLVFCFSFQGYDKQSYFNEDLYAAPEELLSGVHLQIKTFQAGVGVRDVTDPDTLTMV